MRSFSCCAIVLLGGLTVLAVFSEVSGKKVEGNSRKEENEGEKPTTGRKSRGIWIGGDHRTGYDHGHGHGWMKLHNDRHHDHSTKLSEAYVKFHGLGEKGNKGGGGILGKIGNILTRLGIGQQGDADEDGGGWGSNNDNNNNNNNNNNNDGGWSGGGGGMGGGQPQIITVAIPTASHGPPPHSMSGGGGGGGGGHGGGGGGGGGGGWGAPPSMMQMQSGWGNPQMQMVVAQPTGWASAQSQMGGSNGGKGGNNRPPTGWATGDFASYNPPKGNRNKGNFQLNFPTIPTGKPAYIQKLKPIIDLPKIAVHGWRR